MSKRRVERDLTDLEDKVYHDLDPEERLQYVWIAEAEGERDWMKRLIRTTPSVRYDQPDRAFLERKTFSTLLLQDCVYDLQTTFLKYKCLEANQRFAFIFYEHNDGEVSESVEEAMNSLPDEMRMIFAELYMFHYAYQKFATEVLGIDLETWVKPHKEGLVVLKAVTEVLDDPRQIEITERHLNDETLERWEDREIDETGETDESEETEDERITLDQLGEKHYETLVEMWNECVEKIPT